MTVKRVALVTLVVLLRTGLPSSYAADHSCSEYRSMDMQNKLLPLFGKKDGRGVEHIRSEDIDGDGKPDEIELFCPGGGSLIPPDPCTIKVHLSTGKQFDMTAERLSLFKEDGSIYVRTSTLLPPDEPTTMQRAIWQITASGIRLVCAKYTIPLDS